MRAELQDKLYKSYPELFVQATYVPKKGEMICPMAFGLGCDDGWYDLLETLCRFIDFNMKRNWRHYPRVEFSQIKEKWGELRVYTVMYNYSREECESFNEKPLTDEQWEKITNWRKDGSTYFYGAIDFATSISRRTCETCGKPGTIRSDGYVQCRCDKCDEEHNKEMERIRCGRK